MKLILFGGCFDPPHKGHYEMIQKCSQQCQLLIIMPTLHSPLKNYKSSTASHHIKEMLKLLIKDIDHDIKIDEYDLNQSGPSYAIESITYLKGKYPKHLISIAIGADQLLQFNLWKDYKNIMKMVKIIGFNRNNCKYTPISGMNFTWVKNFNMDISSEKIRSDIGLGKMNEDYFISSVRSYIIKNNLYK